METIFIITEWILVALMCLITLMFIQVLFEFLTYGTISNPAAKKIRYKIRYLIPLKSARQKTIEKLTEKNLDTMVRLINEAEFSYQRNTTYYGGNKRTSFYNLFKYSLKNKRKECNGLKFLKVQKVAANESLNRFSSAKSICKKNGYENGVILMQNYIDIYNLYLKEYC